MRIILAKVILRKPSVFLLDEPTNHLDIRSKEILKQALLKYDGTLILVSHDRDFLHGLADTIYEFRDQKIKQYKGDITYFLEKLKLQNMKEFEMQKTKTNDGNNGGNNNGGGGRDGVHTVSTPTTATTAPVSSGKEDYLQRKERERALRKLKSQARIAELEKEMAYWEDATMQYEEAGGK